jgi:hypothetical protein
MCGQRARMAWSWACSSAWRWSGRVSSQRVIWRVFGTAGGRLGRGQRLPEGPDVAADGLLAAGPAPFPQLGVERGGVGDAFVPSLVQVRLELIQLRFPAGCLDQQLLDASGAGEPLHGLAVQPGGAADGG